MTVSLSAGSSFSTVSAAAASSSSAGPRDAFSNTVKLSPPQLFGAKLKVSSSSSSSSSSFRPRNPLTLCKVIQLSTSFISTFLQRKYPCLFLKSGNGNVCAFVCKQWKLWICMNLLGNCEHGWLCLECEHGWLCLECEHGWLCLEMVKSVWICFAIQNVCKYGWKWQMCLFMLGDDECAWICIYENGEFALKIYPCVNSRSIFEGSECVWICVKAMNLFA